MKGSGLPQSALSRTETQSSPFFEIKGEGSVLYKVLQEIAHLYLPGDTYWIKWWGAGLIKINGLKAWHPNTIISKLDCARFQIFSHISEVLFFKQKSLYVYVEIFF